MSISDLVNVTITSGSVSPSKPGFGTPMIAAYHTKNTDRVRSYTSLAAVLADGHTTGSRTYLSAQKVFSQSPCPQRLKIGRCANAPTNVTTLTCESTTSGATYSFSVTGTDGISHAVSYVVPVASTVTAVTNGANAVVTTALPHGLTTGDYVNIASVTDSAGSSPVNGDQQITVVSPTTFSTTVTTSHAYVSGGTVTTTSTDIAKSLAALVTTAAPPGMASCAASSAVVTITSTAGAHVGVSGWNPSLLQLADTTADAGIAADLAAIAAADNDWYGLSLTSNGAAEIAAAAAWAEANKKLFAFNNSDTICGTTSTSDIFTTLKGDAYARSFGLFNGKDTLNFAGAAWLGKMLPKTPGSATYAFKTLAGVPVDDSTSLTDTMAGNVQTKNGNVYQSVASINITEMGITGGGEYVDVTVFLDWLYATIQTNVFGMFANADKIPFTDAGVDMVKSQVDLALKLGVAAGGLSDDPAPTVTAPLVADVDSTNKGKRNLPGVSFTAELAGAIHTTSISGVVQV